MTQAQLNDLVQRLVTNGATFEVKQDGGDPNGWIVFAQKTGAEFTGTQMNNLANAVQPSPVTATTNQVKFS